MGTVTRPSRVAEVDVLIVGAGPAGTMAAIELARRGVPRVLLAGPEGGDRASHDVIVGHAALRTLADAGVRPPPLRDVGTIELRLGDHAGHVLPEAVAAVADRHTFDADLLDAARRTGIDWRPGGVTGIARQDDGRHRATVGTVTVLARHMIIAVGASRATGGDGLMCVQRYAGLDPGPRITLALPAPRTIDPAEKPTCVWMAPGAEPGTVTIGAARTGRGSPDELLRTARATLTAAEPRLHMARADGPRVTGVLNSSFAPGKVVTDGRLLAGDAAGLVNPFTGEGLSYALQSGLLAAEAIAAHPDDPQAAARSYTRKLKRTFIGYFETARHAAHRYHLAWRVLVSTADSN